MSRWRQRRGVVTPKARGSRPHARRAIVGPVMGERVVDLGDASDPPVVFWSQPTRSPTTSSRARTSYGASKRVVVARETRRPRRRGLGRARMMSSRPPREPCERAEPLPFAQGGASTARRAVRCRSVRAPARACSSSACGPEGRVATRAACSSRSAHSCRSRAHGSSAAARFLGSRGAGGGEDLLGARWSASSVVGGRVGAGVPGVGRLPAPGLADVAGQAVQGRGAEQVDLVPGAALGAVDGAGPGVGKVRCAVGAGAGDEPRAATVAALVGEHGAPVGVTEQRCRSSR